VFSDDEVTHQTKFCRRQQRGAQLFKLLADRSTRSLSAYRLAGCESRVANANFPRAIPFLIGSRWRLPSGAGREKPGKKKKKRGRGLTESKGQIDLETGRRKEEVRRKVRRNVK